MTPDNNGFSGDDPIVFLAHTDYPIDIAEQRSKGKNKVMEERHLAALRKGGVNFICDHVGGETNMFSTFPVSLMLKQADYLERTLNGIDCMLQEAEESKDEILIVRKKSDFDNAVSSGRLGIILSIQGGMPIRSNLALLRTFYNLGVRLMNLTANERNLLGNSCMDRRDGGLSHFGAEVVEEMNRVGMVIDIAQLSPQGCLDVFDLSEFPVIASNSNAQALCDHPRNLSDEIIKGLADNGGAMGIHCLPAFLSSNPGANIQSIIDHIEYVVNLVGIDHVGLGPDLLENWPEEKYNCIWEKGQDLADTKIDFQYPEGFKSLTDIPSLYDAILERGYSKNDAAKIMGENFLRVFKETWK